MTNSMKITLQVVFNFGAIAYVSVRLIDGMSLEDCIKRRSEDIIGWIDARGYHEIDK